MRDKQKTFFPDWVASRRVSRALRIPVEVQIIESKKPRGLCGVAVRSVLSAIEDHAGLTGWCTVSNSTLENECSLTLSQVKRALNYLDSEGLIIRSYTKRGNRGRRLRPNWDMYVDSQLSSLSPGQRNDLRCELEAEAVPTRPVQPVPVGYSISGTGPQRIRTGPQHSRTGPGGDRHIRSYRKDKGEVKPIYRSDRRIGLKFSSDEIDQAHYLIGSVTQLIDVTQPRGDYTPQQNWDLVAKICVLTACKDGGCPEHWLADALDSIRLKRDSGCSVGLGYLLSCFRNRCNDNGMRVSDLLSSVFLPPELTLEVIE